jgi:hypothetical protein
MKKNNITISRNLQNDIYKAFAENGINIKITRSFIKSWIKEILQNELLIKQSKKNCMDNFKWGEYAGAPVNTLCLFYNSTSNNTLKKTTTEIFKKEFIFTPAYPVGSFKPSYTGFINRVIGDILLPCVYENAKALE